MDIVVETVARALSAKHYAERFKKPVDDEHVIMNVENNWRVEEGDAICAIRATLQHYMENVSEGMVEAAFDQIRYDGSGDADDDSLERGLSASLTQALKELDA